MAKSSGGTRAKKPTNNSSDYLSESQYQSLVKSIAKNDIPDTDLWEQLSKEQQELALMEAGFSGAITDELENGTVYIVAYFVNGTYYANLDDDNEQNIEKLVTLMGTSKSLQHAYENIKFSKKKYEK